MGVLRIGVLPIDLSPVVGSLVVYLGIPMDVVGVLIVVLVLGGVPSRIILDVRSLLKWALYRALLFATLVFVGLLKTRVANDALMTYRTP